MFGNDKITPEFFGALGQGLLNGGTNTWQALGTGLNAGAAQLSASSKEAKQLKFVEQFAPTFADAVKAGVMSPSDAYAAAITKPKTEFKQLDDGTYGSWDGNNFTPLGKAQKPKDPAFQTLPDGTYGFVDPNTRTFQKIGQAEKPRELPASVQEYEYMQQNPGFGDFKKKADKPADPLKDNLEVMKTYRGDENVKTYQDTRNAYEKVRTSAQLGSAQGDIGLIFGFMKMLDPTSVVREGEYATAANSGGVEDSVINTYNKILSGERLTPQQRSEFVRAAEKQYQNTVRNLEETNQRYQRIADPSVVPPENYMERPKAYEPLNLGVGQSATVDLGNGKSATITRKGE